MAMKEDELIKDIHVLMHPLRFRIVQLLAGGQMHINEISNALGEERRLISYHLLTLEEHGFLDSRYEISRLPRSKGKALRKYRITNKVEEVISEFKARFILTQPG